MRKPHPNFKRREEKKVKGAEDLFELCWYDSLVDGKNKVDKTANDQKKALLQARRNTIGGRGATDMGSNLELKHLDEGATNQPVTNQSVLTQVLRQCNFNKKRAEKLSPNNSPSRINDHIS